MENNKGRTMADTENSTVGGNERFITKRLLNDAWK